MRPPCWRLAARPPAARDDGWAVAAPASAGFDAKRLCALVDDLQHLKHPNIHAVLVARRGQLVLEQYVSGADERWAEPLGVVAHAPAVKHDARSISKSVTSLEPPLRAGAPLRNEVGKQEVERCCPPNAKRPAIAGGPFA